MQKTVFVRDLKLKEEIESIFYVKFSSLMEAKDGRQYMNVILSDSTGDLESRVWSDAEKHSLSISKGSFVQVQGKLNIFQGKKQFIIMKIEKLNRKEINEDDFIFKAQQDPESMYKDLLGIVSELDDYYIRSMLENILDDDEIARRLKLWPAGKTIHHAYRSGLLEHILSCSEMGLTLSKRYNCNTNYVVAGCILHDLCKIYELNNGVDVEYSEEGKLVGHLVRGPELVDKFSYRIKGFPYYTKLHLKHILLSHHGSYEFGSPKIPQTSEAMLVHQIDMMDSKMNAFETIKRTDNSSGDWSNYIKHLDRIVYKSPLPKFTQPLVREERKTKKSPEKKREPKELKQNLGSLLKDFKVEDDS